MNISETIDASFTEIAQLTSQAQLTQESLQLIRESLIITQKSIWNDSPCSFQTPIKTPSKRFKQIRSEYGLPSEGMSLEPVSAIDILRGSEYRGQAFNSFLLFEKDDSLFFIDQVIHVRRLKLSMLLMNALTLIATFNNLQKIHTL